MTPSIHSIRGVRYEVANGVQIRNIGEQRVDMCTSNDQRRILSLQVCDVNKCLLSTARLNEAGQRVMIDGEKSYIEDVVSGGRIPVALNKQGILHQGLGKGSTIRRSAGSLEQRANDGQHPE